jgi:hypothetical protein
MAHPHLVREEKQPFLSPRYFFSYKTLKEQSYENLRGQPTLVSKTIYSQNKELS